MNNQEKDTLLDGELLAKMAQAGAAQLMSKAEEVNELNIFPVPDGDTGDNMAMTIESGIAAIENNTSKDLAQVMRQLSKGMLLGARGNSGVILSQFFAGFAKGLDAFKEADAKTVGGALWLGVEQAYGSVMTPTEGTILTVAREAVEFAVKNITPESTIRSLFADLVKEMYASLQRTPEMLTVLKEAGVVDSGGAGLFYIMDGFYRVLNGEEVKQVESVVKPKVAQVNLDAFGPDDVMTYGYCTEFLLRLQSSKVDLDTFDYGVISDFLATVGDSIVIFRTDSILKVHVHTLTPEKVLAECRKYGEFLTIKMENMSVQHNENEENKAKETKKAKEHKKYAIVAVANGDGVKETFLEFGVDEIVDGGQTQNPSAQDFLDAFDKLDAEHIYVFPNNGNIIMAAAQAKEIYTGATVHVIESKNIGAGYTALSMFDPECESAEAQIEAFNEAIANVSTGYISPSIRDAELNGVQIHAGDFIGFVGKEMMVSEATKADAAHGLIDRMLDGDKFMMTIFFGKDADDADKEDIAAFLAEKYGDIEVYTIDGGQDIYPFIFVVE